MRYTRRIDAAACMYRLGKEHGGDHGMISNLKLIIVEFLSQSGGASVDEDAHVHPHAGAGAGRLDLYFCFRNLIFDP